MHFVGYDDDTGKFDHAAFVQHLEEMANELRKDEGVDVVILLLHGGHPEDTWLVQNLPPQTVDIVVASHTHQVYVERVTSQQSNNQHDLVYRGLHRFFKPETEAPTIITQSGSYGQMFGELKFSWNRDASLENQLQLLHHEKHYISKETDKDPAVEAMIQHWSRLIPMTADTGGFQADDVLFDSNNATVMSDNAPTCGMNKLQMTHFICQAMLETISTLVSLEECFSPHDPHSASLITIDDTATTYYVFPPGAVRGYWPCDNATQRVVIRYDDLFRILSTTERFPVVVFYLPAWTVRLLNAVMQLWGWISTPDKTLLFSRKTDNTYSKHKLLLVRVITNTFLAPYFWKGAMMLPGFLQSWLHPRDEQGKAIALSDLDNCILRDRQGKVIHEVPAIASYLQSRMG